MTEHSTVPGTQPRRRKPYRPPVLEVYGNIHEITQQVGNMGPNDGGGGKTKTA